MNPEARAKMALVALIVVLAAIATLSAAPASAGTNPVCANTRHRIEFGGYACEVPAGLRDRSPEISFPGGAAKS
ncbi:MAG: hypothetical protein H5T64_11115 [Chloroflexi bacterium]|nr:hypothetical protein [Chloroflexota bacterium]